MQTIREMNREGKEARPDEDKTDLQSKTGNRFDTRQGGQDHKTKHWKTLKSDRAGPDHDNHIFLRYSFHRSTQIQKQIACDSQSTIQWRALLFLTVSMAQLKNNEERRSLIRSNHNSQTEFSVSQMDFCFTNGK